jgi:hypothetical protein
MISGSLLIPLVPPLAKREDLDFPPLLKLIVTHIFVPPFNKGGQDSYFPPLVKGGRGDLKKRSAKIM